MFRLNFNSLLSIVLGVRFTEVVTCKSLRSIGDRSDAVRAGRLEPFDYTKLDHVVGNR